VCKEEGGRGRGGVSRVSLDPFTDVSVFQHLFYTALQGVTACSSAMQGVAVYCSVLQCVVEC